MSPRRTRTMRNSLAVALGLLLAGPASAECRDQAFETLSNTVCEASADKDLRLFLDAAGGQRFGSFARIDAALQGQGSHLVFAMNAGMYHPDRAPVGLYVEEGERRTALVTRAGPG